MTLIYRGQFKTVTGLSCAHMLNGWKGKVIPIKTIHSQWKIDNRQFNFLDGVINYGKVKLRELFGDFEDKYQEWSVTEKDKVLNMISQLINRSSSKLLDPNTVPRRGRPKGSKNQNGVYFNQMKSI